MDIDKTPMVRVTWIDARDTETGWLDIKDVLKAPSCYMSRSRMDGG